MGIRTSIYGIDETYKLHPEIVIGSKDFAKFIDDEACLGKCVAYIDYFNVNKMKTVKWLDEHLTSKDDKAYLKQYKDVGYVGEYITFEQIFTHDEILDFVSLYIEDKLQLSPWNRYAIDLKDFVLLLENYDYFVIEWTGG